MGYSVGQLGWAPRNHQLCWVIDEPKCIWWNAKDPPQGALKLQPPNSAQCCQLVTPYFCEWGDEIDRTLHLFIFCLTLSFWGCILAFI